jgi:hypothetical protein
MHLDDVDGLTKRRLRQAASEPEPTPLCFVRRKSGDYLRQMAEVGA